MKFWSFFFTYCLLNIVSTGVDADAKLEETDGIVNVSTTLSAPAVRPTDPTKSTDDLAEHPESPLSDAVSREHTDDDPSDTSPLTEALDNTTGPAEKVGERRDALNPGGASMARFDPKFLDTALLTAAVGEEKSTESTSLWDTFLQWMFEKKASK